MSSPREPELSAAAECAEAIGRFRSEANKNQKLAWAASLGIVVSSAAIPVLIVISSQTGEFVFGKLLPAVFAAVSAVAAGAAQIARPHERWRSCRQYEILLRTEEFRHRHQIGDYATGDRDRRLLERVVAMQQGALDEWRTFVPPTSTVLDTGAPPAGR